MQNNLTAGALTPMQAFRKAKGSNTINITESTLHILTKLAAFNEAGEVLMDAITDGLSDTMSTNEEIDRITEEFYCLMRPVLDSVYGNIGRSVLWGAFSETEFKGL